MKRAKNLALQEKYPLLTGAVPASAGIRFWRPFLFVLPFFILGCRILFQSVFYTVTGESIAQNDPFWLRGLNIAWFAFIAIWLLVEVVRRFISFISIFTGRSLSALILGVRIVHVKSGQVHPGFAILRMLFTSLCLSGVLFLNLIYTLFLNYIYVDSFDFVDVILHYPMGLIQDFNPMETWDWQEIPLHYFFRGIGTRMLVLYVGFLAYALFRNKCGQTLIDRMSQTVMINVKKGRDTHTVPVEVWIKQFPDYPRDDQAIADARRALNHMTFGPQYSSGAYNPGMQTGQSIAYPGMPGQQVVSPYAPPVVGQQVSPSAVQGQPAPAASGQPVSPYAPPPVGERSQTSLLGTPVQPASPYAPPPAVQGQSAPEVPLQSGVSPYAPPPAVQGQPAPLVLVQPVSPYAPPPAASAPKQGVTWEITANDGTVFQLSDALLIGRKPTSAPSYPNAQVGTFVTPDGELSKNHCCIQSFGRAIKIEDLNSTNGVEVQESNGVRQKIVNDYFLNNPETAVVYMGTKELRFKRLGE